MISRTFTIYSTQCASLAATLQEEAAPRSHLHAAEELGLEPREVIVLEDSIEGLTAALAAGHSDVIITKNFYTEGSNFAGATLVLDELPEDFTLSDYLENFRSSFDVQVL